MKTILNKHLYVILASTISILIASCTLLFRIKETQDIYLLFMVWNVFLASIPISITILLEINKKWQSNTFLFLVMFSVWLLFLPNSFYMITDFIHIKNSISGTIWYDITIIFSFAISGLIMGYYSLFQMKKIIHSKFSNSKYFIISILLLSSFGVYLGRYLRWNSWDIIQHPYQIFKDIAAMLLHPTLHLNAYKTTFVLFSFYACYYFIILLIRKNLSFEKHTIKF